MSAVLVLVIRILLAVGLLGFLGYAFYYLWQDLKLATHLATTLKIPVLVISRLDDIDSNGSTFTKAEVLLGRDPACDFPIYNDTVSARHTRLSYHHNQWWVEDLASTNGTFLNDDQVSTPTVIMANDMLRCGAVDLVMNIQSQS